MLARSPVTATTSALSKPRAHTGSQLINLYVWTASCSASHHSLPSACHAGRLCSTTTHKCPSPPPRSRNHRRQGCMPERRIRACVVQQGRQLCSLQTRGGASRVSCPAQLLWEGCQGCQVRRLRGQPGSVCSGWLTSGA